MCYLQKWRRSGAHGKVVRQWLVCTYELKQLRLQDSNLFVIGIMRKISEKCVLPQKLRVMNVPQCTPFCPVFYSALVHHSVSMPSLLVLSYASACLVLYKVTTSAQSDFLPIVYFKIELLIINSHMIRFYAYKIFTIILAFIFYCILYAQPKCYLCIWQRWI